MSIEEVEAILVNLPDGSYEALLDRVAERRGMSPEIEQEWIEEVNRRVAEFDRGDVEGIPMEETLVNLRAMIR